MAIKQFVYEGSKYPALATRLHSISEISAVTGIPKGALRNRLRNTDLVTDDLLYPFNEPKVRLIPFQGEHDKFIDGESYSTSEYAKCAKIDQSTMWGRIHQKQYVTPKDLRPPNPKYSSKSKQVSYTSALETRLERESQKWLSRKL